MAIEHGGKTIVLDQPLEAAKVSFIGTVSETAVSEEEVENTFAAALAAQPKTPTSFTLYFLEGPPS